MQCNKESERKQRRLSAEGAQVVTSRVFSAYGLHLDMVPSFKYMGRVILTVEYEWPAVIQKLAKERMVWRRMSSILSREGARPRLSSFFFKAVIQSVFIFGAETWVVTHPHRMVPGGFPIPGGMVTYRADSMAEARRNVGVYLRKGRYRRCAV